MLIFLKLDSGFEYRNVLSCVYNDKQERRSSNEDFILLIFIALVSLALKSLVYLKSRLNIALKISKRKRVCMENHGSVI